jgi:hypothetical protein
VRGTDADERDDLVNDPVQARRRPVDAARVAARSSSRDVAALGGAAG